MTDLVEFLRARLDEDEALLAVPMAKRMIGRRIVQVPLTHLPESMTRDRDRWRREIEAKRRIVEEHGPLAEYAEEITFCGACGGNPTQVGSYPCYTMRLLALPYADHPDYDPEWAPDA